MTDIDDKVDWYGVYEKAVKKAGLEPDQEKYLLSARLRLFGENLAKYEYDAGRDVISIEPDLKDQQEFLKIYVEDALEKTEHGRDLLSKDSETAIINVSRDICEALAFYLLQEEEVRKEIRGPKPIDDITPQVAKFMENLHKYELQELCPKGLA